MHRKIKNLLLLAVILLNSFLAWSEPLKFAAIHGNQQLKDVWVLQDNGYEFETVLTNKALQFRKTDLLTGAPAYWLKVILYNPSYQPADFNILVNPDFENTLYSYSPLVKKWNERSFGNENTIRLSAQTGPSYQVGGLQHDTLYIKVNVNAPHTSTKVYHLKVSIVPKAVIDHRTLNSLIAWVVGTVVLLLFFLNNLYLYLSFKDKTIIYYLIMQLSGIFYLASTHSTFSTILMHGHFSSLLEADHYRFYSIDHLVMHLSIIALFYGLIQLTRSYLNTRNILPVWDRLLSYGLNAYTALTFVLIAVNVTGNYIESYTLVYDNVFCLLLILSVVGVSIISYKRKAPAAGQFLLANILSLTFLSAFTLYNIFLTTDRHFNHWLPVLAACSQALSFSVALVTRTKTIGNKLLAKEIESRELAFDLKEIAYQNQLKEKEIKQNNADIKMQRYQNEILHDRVEAHQRELASSTLFMVKKTELLTQLKSQLKALKRSDTDKIGKNLDSMLAMLENNNQLDLEWDKFKLHFEQVHPNFFEDLRKKHPSLTQKETRLYAYFQMNLSHKEIATLLDIDPASVRRAKTRLLKKMSGNASTPDETDSEEE